MNTINPPLEAISLGNEEQAYRQSAGNNCGVLKTKYITSFVLSKPSQSTDPILELPLSPTSESDLETHPRE